MTSDPPPFFFCYFKVNQSLIVTSKLPPYSRYSFLFPYCHLLSSLLWVSYATAMFPSTSSHSSKSSSPELQFQNEELTCPVFIHPFLPFPWLMRHRPKPLCTVHSDAPHRISPVHTPALLPLSIPCLPSQWVDGRACFPPSTSVSWHLPFRSLHTPSSFSPW